MDIKRGQHVRDPISGLTGFVTVICENMNGSVQAAVQPKGDGEKFPEAQYIDTHLLEVLDDGLSAKVLPLDNPVKIALGERVRDTVTGYAGIATERLSYLNGCVFFTVQSGLDRDGEKTSPLYLDHKRLVKVEAAPVGVIDRVLGRDRTPQPVAPLRSGTGGPSRAVPNTRA